MNTIEINSFQSLITKGFINQDISITKNPVNKVMRDIR